jgi:phage-related protein
VRAFPPEARQQAGYPLRRVQRGAAPTDWKPMVSVGLGAREVRIHASGEFRVLYVARFAGAVYVRHAFAKKSQQTARHDIDLARRRYASLERARP